MISKPIKFEATIAGGTYDEEVDRLLPPYTIILPEDAALEYGARVNVAVKRLADGADRCAATCPNGTPGGVASWLRAIARRIEALPVETVHWNRLETQTPVRWTGSENGWSMCEHDGSFSMDLDVQTGADAPGGRPMFTLELKVKSRYTKPEDTQ